jgi:hypothetical protein
LGAPAVIRRDQSLGALDRRGKLASLAMADRELKYNRWIGKVKRRRPVKTSLRMEILRFLSGVASEEEG